MTFDLADARMYVARPRRPQRSKTEGHKRSYMFEDRTEGARWLLSNTGEKLSDDVTIDGTLSEYQSVSKLVERVSLRNDELGRRLKGNCACGPFWLIPASTPFRTPTSTSIRIFSSPVPAFIFSGYLDIICML